MKIAIDCRLWNQGGVGRYTRNLVNSLLKIDKKNQYTLILYKNSNKEVARETETLKLDENYQFETKISACHWHTLGEQIQFCEELKKSNYDLIHFTYFSHPIFYNRPFVITIHDLTILKFATGKATTQNYLVYLIKRFGYKKVLEHGIYNSKKILVPTEFVKKDILENFKVNGNKIIVTYEGVGIELQKQSFTLPEKTLPEKKFFLYVGNFYPHKNVELLIEAWKKLKGKYNLVLAGPNDFFAKRIKDLIKKSNLENAVFLVSNLSDEKLSNYYKKAEALVLPSLFEGFGLSVVEAAYFNCKVLLSDIPVFREIAPNNAIFFNPESIDDLYTKIMFVVGVGSSNPNFKRDDDYFQKFSFAKMAEQTLKTYSSL